LLGDERGFSLIEVVVASGVLLTSLAVLANVMTSGLVSTGYARERQAATQLANQTLEKIRALPFNTMKSGLSDADLTANPDENISSIDCGGQYCFGGEQLAHGNNPNVEPLVPHRKTVHVGPTTYTVSSYVTYYQNATSSDARRVTVYASWASPLKAGQTRTVQVQTIIFSLPATGGGTGGGSTGPCSSLAVHPFSGPCQPSFWSVALQDAGVVSITGTIGGIALDHATLYTGHATSDAAIEQISKVDGTAQASGATVEATGGDEQVVGRTLVASHADNDPSGDPSITVYDSKSFSSAVADSRTITTGTDSVTIATTGTDQGSTTSTTTACTSTCISPSSPSPRTCPNLPGYTNETDGLHCSGSSSRTAATVTAQANLATLGPVNLAALGPQANPTVSINDRKAAAGGTTCPTTSGDGCVHTQLQRAALDLAAGALPSNLSASLKPSGFTYFAQIQGLADTVTAEAGIGSLVPTALQTGGTVKVWCATAIAGDALCPVSGYVTKTLSQITGPLSTPVMTVADPSLGGGTTITMSATITPGSTSTSSDCSGTCNRTTATAKSTAPTISVTEKITVGGVTVCDITLVLDPGSITAEASYASAPTS
jgi:type II secretory pathway pseudopilin PulG